ERAVKGEIKGNASISILMKKTHGILALTTVSVVLALSLGSVVAQDWPQWRGPARDAKAQGFSAPANWPGELKREWRVTVGQAGATPALVGNKIYVFARQGGREVVICRDAASGKEIWQQGYEALAATGPAGRHPGPRSSPIVAQGKLITYGVRGTLSCWETSGGKLAWRKDDFNGVWPRFFTASSPLLMDGVCITQLGGEENGGLIGYDLTSGDQKWKWTGDGTAYASPILLQAGGNLFIVALTAKKLVGVS